MSDNPFNYSSQNSPAIPKAAGAKKLIDVLQYVVLVAAILVIIYLFFIIPTQVKGSSMERNFFDGEILFTNRLVQIIGGERGILSSYDYERGDVVVFMREDEPDLIKRVIGLPGDSVRVENSRVFVNGVLLDEPYISADKPTIPGDFMPEGVERVVPEGQFFCLGDNRNNSLDSRSASVGFIDRSRLRGAPFLRVFPLTEFKLIQRPSYNTP